MTILIGRLALFKPIHQKMIHLLQSTTLTTLLILFHHCTTSTHAQEEKTNTPHRCVEGDYVCELVQLHTSGQLTSHRLANLTDQIDTSWQRTITTEVTLSQLNQRVETEHTSSIDLRAHVYNNQNHSEREVSRLLKKIITNFNNTKTNVLALKNLEEKQSNKSEAILSKLAQEMIRVNETLQRDASEQIKEKRRIAELEEKKALWEIERENIHREEAREKLNESDRRIIEAENRTQTMARERIDYESTQAGLRNEEHTKMTEASEMRKETMRRETEEALIRQRAAADLKKANVDIQVAIAKAKAEADGKMKQERENEDIKTRLQKSEAESQRKQVLDAINLIFVRMTEGGKELLSDPERVLRALGTIILLAAGVYFVRECSKVVAREIERRLGKPSLVRETSRMHASGMFSMLLESIIRTYHFLQHSFVLLRLKIEEKNHKEDVGEGEGEGEGEEEEEEGEEEEEESGKKSHTSKKSRSKSKGSSQNKRRAAAATAAAAAAAAAATASPIIIQKQQILSNMKFFQDVILESSCASRIAELAQASKNAQRNHAPYRHLLFYGPAGTGKSMVAKRLALHSGMDWAIMSGGDVGPLGEQAVKKIFFFYFFFFFFELD